MPTKTTPDATWPPAPDDPRWAALRATFPTDKVEKKPQVLRKDDTDRGYCNERNGDRYSADGYYCGGKHAKAVHLDYVGHAGITDRLNEVDPTWTIEPLAATELGIPIDSHGGMWFRMTVLGVTRVCFGDASGKSGPAATKEVIGDAIRNGAMRYGVATYLWSKSDAALAKKRGELDDAPQAPQLSEDDMLAIISSAGTPEALTTAAGIAAKHGLVTDRVREAGRVRRAELEPAGDVASERASEVPTSDEEAAA